jgi:hypothetical protein
MHPITRTNQARFIALTLVAAPSAFAQTWDDYRVFGQIDAKQTNYNEVVPNRLFHPAGVLIDRLPAPAPSRLYVWDSGNNRILGFDHAGRCEGGPPQLQGSACTENSMCGTGGRCTADLNGAATIVIGQPSGYDQGACNGDNTRLAPARPDSLCAIPYPYQISPLEGPRANQMAADAAHNLYVVDLQNNRLLRYTDPFTTDRIADSVWGQADFVSRDCNRGRTAPDATTLCTGRVPGTYFLISGAVDVTSDGKAIWVADYGNNRVLRFRPGKAQADLVLGQRNMFTANQFCTPNRPLDAICRPAGIRYDAVRDRLYVLEGDGDSGNSRILVFDHPSTNGQAANAVFGPPPGSSLLWPRGLTLDAAGNLWVSDTSHGRIIQYDPSGIARKVLGKGDFAQTGCIGGLIGDNPAEYPQVCEAQGGVGIDRDGSVYVPDLQNQDVVRFPAPIPAVRADGVAHSPDAHMLSGYSWSNHIGASALANPGYVLFLNDQQLVVADRRRILFWNDYLLRPTLAANGVLVQPNFNTQFDSTISHDSDFWALAHDVRRQLMYAAHGEFITAWSTAGGLRSGQAPAFQISNPLPLRGGGTTTFAATGITIDPQYEDVAWISDMRNSRVLRIVDASKSTRYVDLILGQPNAVIGQPGAAQGVCNRGNGNARVVQDGFCHPAEIKFDPAGNLFVVDGTWEGNRDSNARMLQFDKASLPPVPSPQLVFATGGPLPARVYGKDSFNTNQCNQVVIDLFQTPCAPLYVAFQPGTNNMIMTVDAYTNALDNRVFIYADPVPPQSGPIGASGVLPFRMNQAGAVAFDTQGNFAILDHTWNRVLLVVSPPTRYIAPVGSGVYFTNVPAPVTVEQVDRSGAPVSLPMATASSDTGEAIVTSNAPAIFAPGTTIVSFCARDGRGNSAVASTTVTVRDTTPPVFVSVPAPIVVTESDVAGTPVTIPAATVTDNCECAVVTSNAPPRFPIGQTTVTFAAIDAAGNRSTATTSVTVLPSSCAFKFVETFNGYEPHSDPSAWVDYKSKGHTFQVKEGFRTARHDGTMVFESTDDDRASEYRTKATSFWRDYEWKGRVRLPQSKSDASLLFYSNVPAGRFYQLRIRHESTRIELLKGFDNTLSGTTRADFTAHADRWYRFRIRVTPGAGGNRIQARVWQESGHEPSGWSIDANDRSNPLTAGGIGVIASDQDTWFDDFKVQSRYSAGACE